MSNHDPQPRVQNTPHIEPRPTPGRPTGFSVAGPYTVTPGEEGTYRVTITAVIPNAPSSPDSWDFETLLDHLCHATQLVSDVTAVELVPRGAE